ncbi:MAG TPA: aminotransferase class IV [Brevundimonas sp.]|nr:aminotransferase class IV [Brevundimonas sp.]
MAGALELSVDGRPATVADLTSVALVNYGAYTSFAVEEGGVRGLDLHLERLETSATELFGEPVGQAQLRDLMRLALGDRREAWMRVGLFAPEIGPRTPGWTGRPRVLILVSPPAAPLADVARLAVQPYGREAAHLKHTATFGLIRARRLALAEGSDDALFIEGDGRVSEGSLWNIGFVRGDEVVWPQADMLAGVAQALVGRGLASVGMSGVAEPVRVSDVGAFDGAFYCNSATPACRITQIGDQRLKTEPALIDRIRAAWASNPPQVI